MKHKTIFACQKCGSQSPKWLGKCPDCGSWNSMVEEALSSRFMAPPGERARAVPICDVPAQSETRVITGIGELDRVLGGGIVPGSLVLIGGDPGIGKSTLLLQAMLNLAASVGPVLYVSGEESASQTRLRGERLGVSHKRVAGFSRKFAGSDPGSRNVAETGGYGCRFDPDRLDLGAGIRSRQCQPGARIGRQADAAGQGEQHPGIHRRPCHQRRLHSRTTCAGAYGRYGALFRGATAAIPSVSCGRLRIVSVPPTRSVYLK